MRSVLSKVFVVGVILRLLMGVALAAEDPEALIHQGVELRKAGQDARAEGYFRRAYELAPTPRTAAQLGLVELALGDYFNAEAHLSEALAKRDAWIVANAGVLQESRERARKRLVRVEIVGSPPNAILTFEGGAPQHLPADGVVWASAEPPATLRIEAPGHGPVVFHIVGAAGQRQRVVVELPLEEARDAAPRAPVIAPPATGAVEADRSSDRSPGRALRVAGISTAAVGVVAGVLGVVLYERGTNELHDYQAAVNSDGKIPWNPGDQNWESTRNTGVALLIAGGAAVAGGVTLFLVGRSRAANDAENGLVSFLPSSRGASIGYRMRF
jgi:hypothetical protein